MGTDGLWARLRGGAKRVVLLLVDSATGLLFPPVVVEGEEGQRPWEKLFCRAREAGLDPDQVRGVASDGARGLVWYLGRAMEWVNHQRCVFHLWRGLSGELARAGGEAAAGLAEDVAKEVGKQAREQLVALLRRVFDAGSEGEAQAAAVKLAMHRLGGGLAMVVGEHLEAALVHLKRYNRGLMRVSPEWCWRDFRLRLSRGRNHGSEVRLERAALLWAVYRNFTPSQWRSERKRSYRRAGESPLEMGGIAPGRVSYLDALRV